MEKYLFIAEKASLMKEVQSVYRKHKSEIDSAIGGEIVFTAVAGHVCGFANPKSYPDWDKPWKDIQLPIVPEKWKIEILANKKKVYDEVVGAYNKNNCTAIIVGTDSDTEGNGIYYLLEQRAGWTKKKALRFFESDLTEKSIKKELLTMKDYRSNPRDVRMTECYLIRSTEDWKYGMNLTIKGTVKSGALIRIGRVKAPAIRIVYDNSMAIDNFVPKTTYQIQADYKEGFDGICVSVEDGKPIQYETEKEAQDFIAKITGNKGIVRKITKKTVKTNAPKLYKLSDLQVEAGSRFGYSPTDTLGYVQSLYEKKCMSYPRTDGRYISTEKAKEMPDILKAISAVSELEPLVKNISPTEIVGIVHKTNYVNDKEVEKKSHDALIPTSVAPDFSKLSQDEKNIYLMVARRLLSIFYPPLEEEKTVAFIDIDGHAFKSNGTVVAAPGWTLVVPKKREGNVLPALTEHQEVEVESIHTKERTTTPPKRLTTATLIETMENIGNTFQDENYKSIMKETSGIGTPSSRGKIIDDIIESQYVEVKKNALYITALGKEYIENLLGYDIIDAALTAELEIKMKEVKEGTMNPADVKAIMDSNLMKMLAQMDSMQAFKNTNSKNGGNGETKYKCPLCGGKIIDTPKACSCEACDFKLWKTVAGKNLTANNIRDLFTRGETSTIKGFTSSSKKQFDARLKMVNGKISFDFSTGFVCPECGKDLRKMSWGYGCSGYSDGCKFVIGNEFAGHKLTDMDIHKLIKGETIGPFDKLISSKGTPYKAQLKYEKQDGKYKMIPVF